jgi:hypothetical protein
MKMHDCKFLLRQPPRKLFLPGLPTLRKPPSTVLSKLLDGLLFIQPHIISNEHISPPPVGPLVNESGSATLKNHLDLLRTHLLRMRLHILKRTPFHNPIQPSPINLNIQKLCNPLDFTAQIRLQIIIMYNEHIRQFPHPIPPTNRLPNRQRHNRLVIFVLENVQKIPPRIRIWSVKRTPHTPRRLVDQLIEHWRSVEHMVMQAPNRISAIPRHKNIFRLRAEDEVLERRVGFDEAAVFLRFELREGRFEGGQAHVDPRGSRVEMWDWVVNVEEDELGDDLLHPGGAGFAPAGDNDVVRAEREVVPARCVHMVGLELEDFDGPLVLCFGRGRHVDVVRSECSLCRRKDRFAKASLRWSCGACVTKVRNTTQCNDKSFS